MTPPPLVSCIIPAHNAERFIADALDSVVAQAHRPLEIIVVDDGSTDGTAQVVRRFQDVRYVRQDNAGPPVARNHGLRMATGEFIAFLDADDRWAPEKLAIQFRHFVAQPSLAGSVGHADNFGEPGIMAEAERRFGPGRGSQVPAFVTGTLLARRSAFDVVGPLREDERHMDSTEWFLRARERGVVVELLPDVLLFRRLHQDSFSFKRAADSRDAALRLIKATLDRRHRKPTAGG